ncbi:hypothetical protein C8A05DRAFT_38082 [Staphylotrichum tortipilum]|uniref:Uncharacterized protein n=1 Tax=Staphylotrichum tortipilum TaxID=2831512 RepID=A0AAN6MCA4_9PEZI|nr:hypothetical protein C8A05DRAFT_38082 [Staphylotrichum longicolle]
MARPRSPLLTGIPILLNLLSLILLCFVIFSGLNNRLTQFHWLSTSTTNFTLPSPLSSSSYLSALTSLSKTDFSGPLLLPATALSLPSHSTLHLLTTCSHNTNTDTCTSPSSHPPLPPPLSTPAILPLPPSLLSKYTATFLALVIIYPLGAALSLLAVFAPRRAWAAILSGLSAVVLFAATTAAAVVFQQLATTAGDLLEGGGSGLVVGVGKGAVAGGFVAAGLVGVAGGLWWWFGRGEEKGGLLGSVGKKGMGGRYVQIERQKGSRLDEDWAAPDEYSGGGGGKTSSGPGGSVPLVPLRGNRQTRDLGTAYEPFSNPR